MLQPDNSQTTADAVVQILTLLSNSSRPGFQANAEPFRATTASIWINCLWFVSLVLSLASALFGMIAKQ